MPMDAVNRACVREKSIRHGHPSTLHLFWARRPLAAARAVIFAQMVDDPSGWPECFPDVASQGVERVRLHAIIERMVTWEATTDEEILEEARIEIWRSWQRECDWRRAQELGGPEAYRVVLGDWLAHVGRLPSRASIPPDERVFGLSEGEAMGIARTVTGKCEACGTLVSAIVLLVTGPRLCRGDEVCRFEVVRAGEAA